MSHDQYVSIISSVLCSANLKLILGCRGTCAAQQTGTGGSCEAEVNGRKELPSFLYSPLTYCSLSVRSIPHPYPPGLSLQNPHMRCGHLIALIRVGFHFRLLNSFTFVFKSSIYSSGHVLHRFDSFLWNACRNGCGRFLGKFQVIFFNKVSREVQHFLEWEGLLKSWL